MQLENYIRDGRLEMSEVMATQFTDMFRKIKNVVRSINASKRFTDTM